MATSRVIDKLAGNGTTTAYAYDAFGRRTLVQDAGSATIKTLYDLQGTGVPDYNNFLVQPLLWAMNPVNYVDLWG